MGNLVTLQDQNLTTIAGCKVYIFDGEPFVKDLDLGERLGYARPRTFRALIKSHIKGEKLGRGLVRCAAQQTSPSGGRPTIEYYLDENAAYKACVLADTDIADEVQNDMIDVFKAWRKGHLVPAQPKAIPERSFMGRLINPYNTKYLDVSVPQPLALFLKAFLEERNQYAQFKIPDEMWSTNLDSSASGTKAFKNVLKENNVVPVGKCKFMCDGKFSRYVNAYAQCDRGVIYKGFEAYFEREDTPKYLESRGVPKYEPKSLTLGNILEYKQRALTATRS